MVNVDPTVSLAEPYVSDLTSDGRLLYACPYCPYTSVRRYTVKLHQRTHTGERPFVCNVCSRRFVQRTHLMVHQKRHVGLKTSRKLECPDCDAQFSNKRSFKLHRLSHSCGANFTLGHS
ncbi:hypothetical protein MTO96_025909 [Rhipicephalus appendiculatus]